MDRRERRKELGAARQGGGFHDYPASIFDVRIVILDSASQFFRNVLGRGVPGQVNLPQMSVH